MQMTNPLYVNQQFCKILNNWRIAVLVSIAISGAAAQTPSFTISTVAGNGRVGYSGDGGPATNAALSDPRGVITDPAGNVFFCDRGNNVVRKIDLSGTITTVAGTGASGYNGDNTQGTQARLNSP